MKKNVKRLVLATVLVVSNMVQSQESHEQIQPHQFYVRAGGGYVFQTGKTEFNNADPNGLTGIEQSTDVTVSSDGSSATVKSLNGTLGSGFKFNITGGYMFNPYVGGELGINYFDGDRTLIGRLNSPQMKSEENAYLGGVDIAPGIYLTPSFKKWNPYARIGAIVPVSGKLNIETKARQINGGGSGTDLVVNAKSEVTSKFSVGYFGALGMTYPISKNMVVFGEFELKNISIKSKSAEIISYQTTAETGGQSQLVPGQQLTDLSTYEKKFIFSDDYSQSTTTSPNQGEARMIPTQYVNSSGTGINVGVRYSF
ncbi:porin family protein [Flavobacteriaceae bacterium F08102]|nr:porin family protein [Flavobacteriaceae bacterium F08102]